MNWRNLREYIRSCEVGKHLDTSKLGELLLKANTREQNQALYNEIVRQSTGLWDVLTKDYELQAALKALRDACGSDDTRPAGKQEPVSTTAATTPAPAPAKTATQTRPNGTLTCTQQPANPRKRKDRASQDTGDGYDWIMRWEILAAGLAEKYARVQVAALNTRGTACRASAIVGILVAIGSMRCVRHEDGGDYNFQYQRQRGHHTPDGEYLRCESWPGFWSRRRVQLPVDPSPPRHSRTFWTSSRTVVQREGVTERDRTRATGLREGRMRLGLRQVPPRSPLGPQQDPTEHISVEVRLAVGHEGTWKKPLREGGTEILESAAAVRRWRPSKVDSPLTFETWRSTELHRNGHARYESGEEAGVERVALMLQGRRQGWSGYDKERAYMWNEMWGFKHNPSGQQATQRQRITVELPVRMAGLPLERPADWLGIQEIDRMHRGRADGKGGSIEWSRALTALKISLFTGRWLAHPNAPVWRQVLMWMKPKDGETASDAVRGHGPSSLSDLADHCKMAQAHEGAGRRWPAKNGTGEYQACRIVIEVGEGRTSTPMWRTWMSTRAL